MATHRHIPGPQVQGEERERALGPLEGRARSLKDFHGGGMETLTSPTWKSPHPNHRSKLNKQMEINLEFSVHPSPWPPFCPQY